MKTASGEFADDPCSSVKRGNMVRAARALLSAVTRLLILADMADVYKLLVQLKVVSAALSRAWHAALALPPACRTDPGAHSQRLASGAVMLAGFFFLLAERVQLRSVKTSDRCCQWLLTLRCTSFSTFSIETNALWSVNSR